MQPSWGSRGRCVQVGETGSKTEENGRKNIQKSLQKNSDQNVNISSSKRHQFTYWPPNCPTPNLPISLQLIWLVCVNCAWCNTDSNKTFGLVLFHPRLQTKTSGNIRRSLLINHVTIPAPPPYASTRGTFGCSPFCGTCCNDNLLK